jgi:hypothetical protein
VPASTNGGATMTQAELKDLLHYNPDTGIFTRNRTCGGYKKGGESGCLNGHGYRCIGINNKLYKRSRLAWLYVYGYFPENLIDHIDRDKSNDRITNLREASPSCNVHNRSAPSTNTSGIKGVRWSGNRWKASICVNGKIKELGGYLDKLTAARIRYEAEVKYNYVSCDEQSSALRYINSFQ